MYYMLSCAATSTGLCTAQHSGAELACIPQATGTPLPAWPGTNNALPLVTGRIDDLSSEYR